MTRRSNAPDPGVGGAADDYPEHARLRQNLADWYDSTGFADDEIEYQRLGILAEIDQRAMWDREAGDVRRYAASITPVPPDPIATQLVRDMNRLEAEGRVVWNDWTRNWEKPRPAAAVYRDRDPLTADALLSRFDQVRPIRGGWTARCPAHEDRHPSLSIKRGDRWWLTHCHAGCSSRAICAAVGLTVSDLALGGDDG
jgi:hypothetical protein